MILFNLESAFSISIIFMNILRLNNILSLTVNNVVKEKQQRMKTFNFLWAGPTMGSLLNLQDLSKTFPVLPQSFFFMTVASGLFIKDLV